MTAPKKAINRAITKGFQVVRKILPFQSGSSIFFELLTRLAARMKSNAALFRMNGASTYGLFP